jgi:threonyl-tRNA synthetase
MRKADDEMRMADSAIIPGQDLTEITGVVSNITRQKQPFERIQLTKEEAMEMFSYNPFKQALIRDKVPEGATCTAYKCGPLIDLCRGPHVPHTGFVKAFSLTKNSGAYWKGCASNTALQRVYGISFPEKKQLKAHEQWLAEAKATHSQKVLSPFFF